MALLYRVNTDEMNDQSQFGDIMLQVQNFLYEQHGIKLINLVCDIDELLEKKFEGMEILNEEFIPKNLSDSQIINIIGERVRDITRDGILIIIDQYIFPQNYSLGYLELLTSILKKENIYKNIIFIVSDREFNNDLYNSFLEEAIKKNIVRDKRNIKYVFSREFHDRFWITPSEEGFICGSSLNGIGKKYSSIYDLSKEDCKEIMSTLRDKKLINF